MQLEDGGLRVINRSMNDSVVYMVLDDTTPILKVSTFAPYSNDPNLTSPMFFSYLNTIKAAYEHIRANNYTNLILDMSRNGFGTLSPFTSSL